MLCSLKFMRYLGRRMTLSSGSKNPSSWRRVVLCDNLRSAHNVGSIFRTASALAYLEIALCGVCAIPEGGGGKKLTKSARGEENRLSWRAFENTNDAVEYYKGLGFEIAALESDPKGIAIKDFKPALSQAWIVGNEALGISPDILKKAQHIVSLPVRDEMSSINVSCAFSAAAYIDQLFLQA